MPATNQIASFFATATSAKSSAAVSTQADASGANSNFENLVAQSQADALAINDPCLLKQPGLAQTTGALLNKGQAVSSVPAVLDLISASEILQSVQQDSLTPAELAPPSDLAGFALATQQTQLAQLVQAQLGVQAPSTSPVQTAQSPAVESETAAGAAVLNGGVDLAAQMKSIASQEQQHPAFAQLLADAQQTANAIKTPPKAVTAKGDQTSNTVASAVVPGVEGLNSGVVLDDASAVNASSNIQSPNNLDTHHSAQSPVKQLQSFDGSSQLGAMNAQPAQSFSVELTKLQSASPGATASPPVPLDALAVQIARRFDQGVNQFEISLHPAELGKLDISLNVTDDGRVHAVLRAERAETLELLRQDSRALENQLRQAGLDVGSNALSFQLSQGNGQRQNSSTSDNAFASSILNASVPTDETHSQFIAVRKRDGLDIHV